MEMEDKAQSPVSPKSSSSRKMVIILVVVLLLLLTAGGYMFLNKQSANLQKVANVSSSKATPSTGGSMVSSLKDLFSKTVSMQCDFTDEDGRKTVAYIKSGAVRSDVSGKTAQDIGSVIMKDKKIYFWNGKQGTMMEFDFTKMMENAEKITPGVQKTTTPSSQNQSAEMMQNLEKYKQNCKPAVISDSLFTPPSDVKFTDVSQMMKANGLSEEQLKQIQQQAQQEIQKSGSQNSPSIPQ